MSVTRPMEDGNFTLTVSWTTPKSGLPKSVEDGTLYLSSSVFAAEDGTCNGFGNCRQPNETTTTPVPAAPPLAAIVGAIVAVGVVLLVLLIVGAVPLVMCLMRRQDRTKREILGKVEFCTNKICLYLSLSNITGCTYVHICTCNATYFSHVMKNLTHAQVILFGVQFCIRLLILAC